MSKVDLNALDELYKSLGVISDREMASDGAWILANEFPALKAEIQELRKFKDDILQVCNCSRRDIDKLKGIQSVIWDMNIKKEKE